MFSELDVVVVRELRSSSRHVDGTEGLVRQPVLGDLGAIVQVLAPRRYTVECVEDGTGCTIWLADFDLGELTPPPPGWNFEVVEISANVYRATGNGPRGMRVESTDVDPTRAIANCRAFAVRNSG
ncbi:MAG TPA: hypothetical protein VIM73_15025 [Polyangiaceae bacterium]